MGSDMQTTILGSSGPQVSRLAGIDSVMASTMPVASSFAENAR
jgi:hypothetical protein